MRGIIHYELLQNNQTITAELYFQQLKKLSAAIARNRPALINRKRIILQQEGYFEYFAHKILCFLS